jgi:hypothetical protein
MTKAKVDFSVYGQTKGTIDSNFVFAVRVYDNYLNAAYTNAAILKNVIMVQWPNPAESKRDHLIVWDNTK